MATQAQINGNRKNATKSTGPASEDGKARSSRNALKHGVYARVDPITSGMLGEDVDEVAALVDGVVGDLAPRNTLEHTSAVSLASRAIGQLRVSRLVAPLVEGVQVTMEENKSDDEHRLEYELAKRLRTALDIADNYDGEDLGGVDWWMLEREMWMRVEVDPDLNPSRPLLMDTDGNRRDAVGDEQLLVDFIHSVNQRFESWDDARRWADDLLADHTPGAWEESRRLMLAEAQRIMAELERVAALQERADRGVTRALAAHKSIRELTGHPDEVEESEGTIAE